MSKVFNQRLPDVDKLHHWVSALFEVIKEGGTYPNDTIPEKFFCVLPRVVGQELKENQKERIISLPNYVQRYVDHDYTKEFLIDSYLGLELNKPKFAEGMNVGGRWAATFSLLAGLHYLPVDQINQISNYFVLLNTTGPIVEEMIMLQLFIETQQVLTELSEMKMPSEKLVWYLHFLVAFFGIIRGHCRHLSVKKILLIREMWSPIGQFQLFDDPQVLAQYTHLKKMMSEGASLNWIDVSLYLPLLTSCCLTDKSVSLTFLKSKSSLSCSPDWLAERCLLDTNDEVKEETNWLRNLWSWLSARTPEKNEVMTETQESKKDLVDITSGKGKMKILIKPTTMEFTMSESGQPVLKKQTEKEEGEDESKFEDVVERSPSVKQSRSRSRSCRSRSKSKSKKKSHKKKHHHQSRSRSGKSKSYSRSPYRRTNKKRNRSPRNRSPPRRNNRSYYQNDYYRSRRDNVRREQNSRYGPDIRQIKANLHSSFFTHPVTGEMWFMAPIENVPHNNSIFPQQQERLRQQGPNSNKRNL